ncbi:MAG: hypothetical protein JSV26_05695 [bacterium]|nr:MAG: hypothetical protein JSV26_05695 [bacterium]
MYYRMVIEGGHLGAGKATEMVRYFRSDDPVDLFSTAARMPRAKGKTFGTGVKLIERITREQFEEGISRNRIDPYLRRRKESRKKRKKSDVLFH